MADTQVGKPAADTQDVYSSIYFDEVPTCNEAPLGGCIATVFPDGHTELLGYDEEGQPLKPLIGHKGERETTR